MSADRVVTHVAHAGHGAHRFAGHDLFGELLGKETFASLMALSVGGRRITVEERSLLDDLAVILSVADPRIWPLKINRLIGSYGGTLAAFCSTQICVEGDVIGMWSTGNAAQALVDLRATLDAKGSSSDGDIDAFLATRKRMVGYGGYGVTLRKHDERLVALRERLHLSGRDKLPFWQLQERLSEVMNRTRELGPTIVIGTAAVLLDMGFDPRHVAAMGHFFNLNVFVANAVEGAAQAPAILRSLPTDRINYIGPPERLSPRAKGNTK